jgi:hypothetical protein
MPDEAQAQDAGTESNDFDFDAWLGEQPDHVKKGYEGKTSGLHSALETERTQRKEFAKQLKDLTTKAEKGSEAEKALGEMSSRVEQAEHRAAFYEDAGKPEIGCTNPKAAFLVASADNLFKRSGEPDWAAIKQAAPELFASRKTPPGNAGTGNGAPAPKGGTMNDYIRAAAGRS